MGASREKMIVEIRLRNFSPRTEQSYVSAMVGLAKYYHRSPDQLTQDEIRGYLLHLKERGLSSSSRIPEVLSPKEVERLLLAATKRKSPVELPRSKKWGSEKTMTPHSQIRSVHPSDRALQTRSHQGACSDLLFSLRVVEDAPEVAVWRRAGRLPAHYSHRVLAHSLCRHRLAAC